MMVYQTLIDCETLNQRLYDVVVVDCRYELSDTMAGENTYLQSHIKGAVFADLKADLSGPPLTDHGRHPLPSEEAMITLFERLGISNHTQVVVYDSVSGSFAGRLWWMLRYMGHTAVAVLDGGWQHWQQAKFALGSGIGNNPLGKFHGEARKEWLVTIDQVFSEKLLIDARDVARYRGESESLDKAAGHIPGAINHPWKNNIANDGCFKPIQQLQQNFTKLLADIAPQDAVFYCGSGVTACHNLLALSHAELGAGKLYVGSWSEWSADPKNVLETGTP